MTISDATPVHAAWMADLHRAAFPPAEAWSRDVMFLHLELPTTIGFLHPDGGLILARSVADEAEILTLAVHPEKRRAGIGGALLRAAMDRVWAAGAATMFLEVAVTNAPAQALYRAHGFQNAGMRRRYYADGGDALVLRCTLSGTVADS